MKPGDLIEWRYTGSCRLVGPTTMLQSTSMNGYVPIGSGFVHLLVSFNETVYIWLNNEGIFHALVDDTLGGNPTGFGARVFSRTVED